MWSFTDCVSSGCGFAEQTKRARGVPPSLDASLLLKRDLLLTVIASLSCAECCQEFGVLR